MRYSKLDLARPLAAGCLVVPHHRAGIRVAIPAPRVVIPAPTVAVSYQPLRYQGQVVFCSGAGVPFIYADGVRLHPPGHARQRYVSHHRTHRHAYHSWERHHREPNKHASKLRD